MAGKTAAAPNNNINSNQVNDAADLENNKKITGSDSGTVSTPDDNQEDAGNQTTNSEQAALIDFKTLEWWQGGIILIAETVSLGILSLPSVLASVGLAPGIALIMLMSILSTYSCVVLGEFRKAHMDVENFGDAVEVVSHSLGPVAAKVLQEFFGWAQVIFQVLVAGSHILTWTICLNTLTDSGVCTVLWAFVGLAIFWFLNFPRTLSYASYMSIASCLSIVIATLMTVGDVSRTRPIGNGHIDIARAIGVSPAMLAVTNIAVAFSSHSCFFSVYGEFKKPNDWPKALAMLQIVDTSLYLVAAIVIYHYVGPDVPSPALSAAGSDVMRKAIWGVAIPTIVIAGVIYGHVAAEYVFTRIFRGTKHEIRRTWVSTVSWLAITFGIWLIATIVSLSIPVFNSLLGLVAALFVSWFSYGLPGIFWLWMHHGNYFNKGWGQVARFVGNIVLVVVGALLCVLGLWASIEAIAQEKGNQPWSCASNAA